MPVYLHFANLIIDKAAIEKKYQGGIAQFRIDHSIDEDNDNQEDNELIAMSSMDIDDFDFDQLISKGLHFDEKLQFSTDFTLLPRYGTYLWNTDWIADNKVFAWHKESDIDLIAKAEAIGKQSMEKISEMLENGENPFATIV